MDWTHLLGTIIGTLLANLAMAPWVLRRLRKVGNFLSWTQASLSILHDHAGLRMSPPPPIEHLDQRVTLMEIAGRDEQ